MSLSDFINAAGKIAQNVSAFTSGYNKTEELKELLQAPRETGVEYITDLVKTLPAEQLDQYEMDFLQVVAYGIYSPDEKIRAMELYAWLKLMETKKYEQFRGFPAQDN
jgi:hypothetical protein